MLSSIIIVLNLIILESLLSIDNAAVLAVMVNRLPVEQQKKALRYGIIGAYVLRGTCLLIASWLMSIYWLKFVGGAYLVYLAITNMLVDGESVKVKEGKNSFWYIVCMVELADLAFSIDNIFAAVAMSKNIILIMIGVFIGILAMRFVAGKFVDLMHKYPLLSKSAYIVICILGVRLMVEGGLHYINHRYSTYVLNIMDNHLFDLIFSVLMMCIFTYPLLKKSDKTNRHWFV